MALTAFTRLRLLWGTVDWQHGAETPYTTAQTQAGGASALPPGIGVRRSTLVFDRTLAIPGADSALCHFDWLNFTAGVPDDSWTSTDYTNMETAISTWWTASKAYVDTLYKLQEIRWYRVGPGVVKPNPAERVTSIAVAGSSSGTKMPPQVACSLTFRTAVRRSWGRTYLPLGNMVSTNIGSSGQLVSGVVDALATALNTMVSTAASNDFALVVVSKPLSASLVVEKVEVDSNLDVVRRRRWKAATYKKILP